MFQSTHSLLGIRIRITVRARCIQCICTEKNEINSETA